MALYGDYACGRWLGNSGVMVMEIVAEIDIEELAQEVGNLQRKIRDAIAGPKPRDKEKEALEAFSSYLAIHGIIALRHRPGEGGEGNLSHMIRIKVLIERLQSTLEQFGNTCVYIRRGGLSWGAVALNRRDDDQKNGVFDLQAAHDKAMTERMEQCERLIETARSEREKRWEAEKAIKETIEWAVDRWNSEVKERPLNNVYRRTLDDRWRQIIRKLNGDPVALCGPPHDVLLAQNVPSPVRE